MSPHLVYANPHLAANNGKSAVVKGPLVYCLEEADNGADLSALWIDSEMPLQEQFDQTLWGGTPVVMGIRPEDIYDSEHDLVQHPDSQMEVKITGYELLGSKVLLYFGLRNEKPTEKHRQFSDEDDSNVKKALFTAKVDARTTARYGSKIIVALDPEKIHVFDKETKQAIVH